MRNGWVSEGPYESSGADLCTDVSISRLALSHLCALVNSSEGRVSELEKEGE
jgi:hypothetical protein